MSNSRTFVIIGASQAGGWIAKTLRAEGFEGRVVLIGEEKYLPYERPPLSKGALLGEAELDSTYFWPPETYEELNIKTMLGVRATTIDRTAKQVTLDNGDVLAYDRLAITTGTRPRLLPIAGADLAGVHYLRTMDDTLAIKADIKAGATAVIVGGGWIGLEVAATLSKLGCKSIVVEFADRLCGRAVTPEISAWMLDFHKGHGIDVRLNTGVERFEGDRSLQRAVLSDGDTIECSLAVVGIGVLANSEIAAEAGLDVENGITVDDLCRTSDPDIFSAGDVTNHPNDLLGKRIRLESWENAQNQGIAAGKAMLDKGESYNEIPWFWSDQHDSNIQMIGLPENWDEIATRGNAGDNEFMTVYLKDHKIIGAISVNNPRDLRFAKRLMQSGKAVSASDLADTSIKMQALLKG
jgi:3-phenylpropionate/trans-cinnamate dioxygenase ferredoxin reductase subunit